MHSVLFMCASLTRSAGGIFNIMIALAKGVSANSDFRISACGLEPRNHAEDLKQWRPVQATVFKRDVPLLQRFGYSTSLKAHLFNTAPSLVHLHCLWLYPSLATLSWASRTKRPYAITIHGMLEPWAMQNSRWKKKAVLTLWERRLLNNASFLHVNTRKERDDVRNLGIKAPVIVIPNGTMLPDPQFFYQEREKSILFMGRIHPKKGLNNLILGWSRLPQELRKEWKLRIVGWDDGGHEQGLRDLVSRLHLAREISFLGPKFGDEKSAIFRQSSGFILPSFSEGLPMAVLEAWAHGLPTLISQQCNLPEGYESNASIDVGTDPERIAKALVHFMRLEGQSRRDMGIAARQIAESQFTWPAASAKLAEAYRWALKTDGPSPCDYPIDVDIVTD